jgi:protein required for attachment to host cells
MSTFTVFVADSRHAKVFELSGPEQVLKPIETVLNEHTEKHNRDLGADAPGRMLVRIGAPNDGLGARSIAFQPRRSHKQHATERFARELAARVSTAARENNGDGVLLVASPRLLAELHSHLPRETRRRVVGELARDLVDLPATELRRRVVDLLRRRAVD